MNGTTAVEMALDWLNEPTGAGFWSPATKLRQLNLANRTVYRVMCEVDPTHVAKYSRVTYTAGSLGMTLSTLLGSPPRRVLGVSLLRNNEDPQASNPDLPMTEVHTAAGLISAYATTGILVNGTGWSIDAGRLRLHPVPAIDATLWIRWVPEAREITALSDNLLVPYGGSASDVVGPSDLHDVVAVTLASLMQIRERRGDASIADLEARVHQEVTASLAHRTAASPGAYFDPY